MWKYWICLIVLTAAGNVDAVAGTPDGSGVSALSEHDPSGHTVADEVGYPGPRRHYGPHRYDAGRHDRYRYDGYRRGYPSRPGPRSYFEFGYRSPYPRYYREYGYPGPYRYHYGHPYQNPYRYPGW